MANSCCSPHRLSRQGKAQPSRTPGRLPAAWGLGPGSGLAAQDEGDESKRIGREGEEVGNRDRGEAVMGRRGRTRDTDGRGGRACGKEAGTEVKDENGGETRGPRHSKVRKVWADMVELQAAPGRDLRGHARSWGWGGNHARTPITLEPRPDPGSYLPPALRPMPSQRPAARASSARRRPASGPEL